MSKWTRKLSFPDDVKDDWTILKDGHSVGRVYYSKPQASSGRDPWFWAVQVQPTGSGWCATLEAALEAVRSRVG